MIPQSTEGSANASTTQSKVCRNILPNSRSSAMTSPSMRNQHVKFAQTVPKRRNTSAKSLPYALLFHSFTQMGCAPKAGAPPHSIVDSIPQIAVGYPGPVVLHRLTNDRIRHPSSELRFGPYLIINCSQTKWGVSYTDERVHQAGDWVIINWPTTDTPTRKFLGDPCEQPRAECSARIGWQSADYNYALTPAEFDGLWHAFCSLPQI